ITFVAENNPNLSCIQVDDVTYSNSNWANDIDATARFSTDCSIVYIPDANFKNALLSNTAINTTNDSEISYNEAAAFTGTMDVSFNNIADLTGIEAFVNITRLYCNYNNLTSLEVANNLTLEELRCYSNNLTSLDVSANTALTRLICYDNALTSLDISANTTLTSLYCNNNALTSLNVANGNNTSLITFVAENNPNLSCIQVDDVTYSNSNWTDNIDATASFSTDCRIVYIPDANFKNALLSNTAINTNNDMEISYNEAANVTEISVLYRGIADLTGIEAFVNITELNCSSNSLTSLDISANTALTRLYCANTALTSIDVSANTALTDLWCYGNALTSLDVSANTALTWLDCSNTALTSLNIANGNNTNVYQFDARNNPNLSCIQVDDVTYSNTNWANDIDGTASFSTNCGTGKATKTKTTTNVNVATVIDSSLDNELLFNDTIRVSPNPVINTFSITGSASFKLKQVKMYNVLNEVVLSSTNNQVDASSLPTGMYILKIESTDGEIQTKKIIKK
ncbi:MAG: T9SS type A sorting domain-containing protein, partial [Algibacter sp.]